MLEEFTHNPTVDGKYRIRGVYLDGSSPEPFDSCQWFFTEAKKFTSERPRRITEIDYTPLRGSTIEEWPSLMEADINDCFTLVGSVVNKAFREAQSPGPIGMSAREFINEYPMIKSIYERRFLGKMENKYKRRVLRDDKENQ